MIKISEIRNEVAHSHILSVFQNKNISEKCDDLTYWKFLNYGHFKKSFESNSNQAIRNKFVFSVVIISQKLLLKIRGIKPKGVRSQHLT